MDVDGYIPRSTSGNEQVMGITAIEDPTQPDAMLILVTTVPAAGLAVIDVVWGDPVGAAVCVQRVEHVSCDEPATRVHALHPLGDGGVFIAGLAPPPEHPVAKLWRSEQGWSRERPLAGDRSWASDCPERETRTPRIKYAP